MPSRRLAALVAQQLPLVHAVNVDLDDRPVYQIRQLPMPARDDYRLLTRPLAEACWANSSSDRGSTGYCRR
jgi:hypothetical protein